LFKELSIPIFINKKAFGSSKKTGKTFNNIPLFVIGPIPIWGKKI